jgi:RNA recognition motif-containing protein
MDLPSFLTSEDLELMLPSEVNSNARGAGIANPDAAYGNRNVSAPSPPAQPQSRSVRQELQQRMSEQQVQDDSPQQNLLQFINSLDDEIVPPAPHTAGRAGVAVIGAQAYGANGLGLLSSSGRTHQDSFSLSDDQLSPSRFTASQQSAGTRAQSVGSLTPSTTATSVPANTDNCSGGSDDRTNCNLFVAGLPRTMKDADLRELFQRFGSILSAKVMLDLQTGVSKQFGFVLFANAQSAAAARAAMNGTRVNATSTLHVELSSHKDKDHEVENERVYIRNLPPWTTPQLLEKHFSPFGEIREALILPEKHNVADNRRVGIVRYATVDSARQAIKEMKSAPVFGPDYPLLIRFMETHEMRSNRQQHHQQQQSQSQTLPKAAGSQPTTPSPAPQVAGGYHMAGVPQQQLLSAVTVNQAPTFVLPQPPQQVQQQVPQPPVVMQPHPPPPRLQMGQLPQSQTQPSPLQGPPSRGLATMPQQAGGFNGAPYQGTPSVLTPQGQLIPAGSANGVTLYAVSVPQQAQGVQPELHYMSVSNQTQLQPSNVFTTQGPTQQYVSYQTTNEVTQLGLGLAPAHMQAPGAGLYHGQTVTAYQGPAPGGPLVQPPLYLVQQQGPTSVLPPVLHSQQAPPQVMKGFSAAPSAYMANTQHLNSQPTSIHHSGMTMLPAITSGGSHPGTGPTFSSIRSTH